MIERRSVALAMERSTKEQRSYGYIGSCLAQTLAVCKSCLLLAHFRAARGTIQHDPTLSPCPGLCHTLREVSSPPSTFPALTFPPPLRANLPWSEEQEEPRAQFRPFECLLWPMHLPLMLHPEIIKSKKWLQHSTPASPVLPLAPSMELQQQQQQQQPQSHFLPAL
ncbi:unnamed protein product [Boreogadus saida]